MLERILMAAAAAAAIATAAAVGVVALALALYALVEPFLGPAGAAAVVAAVAALAILLAGLLVARKASARRAVAMAEPEAGLAETLMALVRKRPIMSAGAAVGAGAFALLNPRLVAALVRAFMAKGPDKD